MAKSGQLPSSEVWQRLADFLGALESAFAPKLKSISGLRAIRFGELEVLQAHARELPESCRVVSELYATAGVILHTLSTSPDLDDSEATRRVATEVERVLSSRIVTALRFIEDELRDLATFVPLWMNSIVKRRALMLRPNGDVADDLGEDEFP